MTIGDTFCIISLYKEKKREVDAKASSSLPKGVKENDLKFFLTNGFKVDIIYLYSETNRIKSD